MKKNVVALTSALAFVALFGLAAKGCESMQGGPVHSTDEFRDHVRATTRAGTDTYLALLPAPAGDLYPAKEGSSSCVDDFGWDDGDVTRDEPSYTWDLEYASDADFRAALTALEADWREDGHKVEKVEDGIATTLDGIRVTVHLGYYDHKPELRAMGTCMRYRDTYGDEYDYMFDDDGDGTVDEYEKPSW
ncbi:hypothetical protein AB0I00_39505 [Streptomyces sp. NPDC050803]|uniref:hypothetical protein n=1 Tax=unclassified Streptomyces TaxID=2593676 RepID=UPI00343668EE